MLEKYGKDRGHAPNFCLVQITTIPAADPKSAAVTTSEYYLDDDECPLSILMNHPPTHGNVTFHVKPRLGDSYKRKKKKHQMHPMMSDTQLLHHSTLPFLVDAHPDGSDMVGGMPP